MQLLPTSYIFHGLTEPQVRRIAAIVVEQGMEAGQWVFHEGQEGNELYVIKEGQVELIIEMNGAFLPISVLRAPGQCFGTSALIAPHKYSISARCLKEGALLAIKRDQLRRMVDEDRELGCVIMTNLAEHLLARLNETRLELIVHFRTIFKAIH